MLSLKRFDSFEESKKEWQKLEESIPHYPFQTYWYQKLFAETFSRQDDIYIIGIYRDRALVALGGFEKMKDSIIFLGMKPVLGKEEVTDYGDLLYASDLTEQEIKEVWQLVQIYFKQQDINNIQLDYVREDSKTYHVIANSLESNNLVETRKNFTRLPRTCLPAGKVARNDTNISPYITVPDSWDDYLQSLPRKERHELKRKIKRLEEQHAFHFCSDETIHEDFEAFIRLHRLSDKAKEQFMSGTMKQFFWNIVSAEKTDYRIDFCFLEMDGKRVASVMSFIGQGKALIYNSGFDPEYSYFSVGLILHAYLIKKSIEAKLHVHDFLRGNERYKYNLGAKDIQLYTIHL